MDGEDLAALDRLAVQGGGAEPPAAERVPLRDAVEGLARRPHLLGRLHPTVGADQEADGDRAFPIHAPFRRGIRRLQRYPSAHLGFDSHRWSRRVRHVDRSEEHTSELQSLMRISYAVLCLQKKK